MKEHAYNRDRYLRILRWARNRYTVNGILAVIVRGQPTRYSRIERAAFDKYILSN